MDYWLRFLRDSVFQFSKNFKFCKNIIQKLFGKHCGICVVTYQSNSLANTKSGNQMEDEMKEIWLSE